MAKNVYRKSIVQKNGAPMGYGQISPFRESPDEPEPEAPQPQVQAPPNAMERASQGGITGQPQAAPAARPQFDMMSRQGQDDFAKWSGQNTKLENLQNLSRDQWRDKWMSSGTSNLEGLHDFLSQYGGRLEAGNGLVTTPFGDLLDTLEAARTGKGRPGWTPIGGGGGAAPQPGMTPFSPFAQGVDQDSINRYRQLILQALGQDQGNNFLQMLFGGR